MKTNKEFNNELREYNELKIYFSLIRFNSCYSLILYLLLFVIFVSIRGFFS